MQTPQNAVRVRVVIPGLPDAVQTASRLQYGSGTPESIVAKLNKLANKQGLPATYTLATEEEYQAYRAG